MTVRGMEVEMQRLETELIRALTELSDQTHVLKNVRWERSYLKGALARIKDHPEHRTDAECAAFCITMARDTLDHLAERP